MRVRISGIPYFVWRRGQGARVCRRIRLWQTSVNGAAASQQTFYYNEIRPFYTAVDRLSDTLFLAMVLHMRAPTADGRNGRWKNAIKAGAIVCENSAAEGMAPAHLVA